MSLTIVAAVGANGGVGFKGSLPWYLPSDLKRFRALTLGKAVIMGRNTWQSLPIKPLPQRLNIVVSTSLEQSDAPPQPCLARSFEEAMQIASEAELEAAAIGGASIWREAMNYADVMEITEVCLSPAADTFFPSFDAGKWREVARTPARDQHVEMAFVRLERVQT